MLIPKASDALPAFLGMLMITIALSRGTFRFNRTWPTSVRSQHQCYIDHTRAFFKILGSVDLGNDMQRHHALIQFDFRKLSFATHTTSLNAVEMVLLKQNVRNSNSIYTSYWHSTQLVSRLKLLQPYTFRNWWAPFSPMYSDSYYIIGHGAKRALLVIDPTEEASIRPYSSQHLKEWAKKVRNIKQYTGRILWGFQESKRPKTLSRSWEERCCW